MVNKESYSKEGSEIKAIDIQRVAFSVVGLLFIGTSSPKLVTSLMNLIAMKEMINNTTRVLPELLGDIAQLVIGLGIFLWSQRLVNLLKHIINSELRQEQEEREED